MDSASKPWAAHVQAYLSTLRYEILAIRLLARDGVSIADGKRYKPLPEADGLEAVLQELEKALAGMETVLGFEDGSRPENEESTRFALRIRLESLADGLPRNLVPSQVGRSYGEVPLAAADVLIQSLPKLKRLVQEAARLVESGRKS